MTTRYVLFDASVEQIAPDEEQTFQSIAASMHHISTIMFERYQHAVRSVHAKTHGVLKGELVVRNDLPRHLAQGVFAVPGVFSVLARYSTTPGDILADSISTPRGLALKILGVPGAKLDGHEGESTQDFVMVNGWRFRSARRRSFSSKCSCWKKNTPTIRTRSNKPSRPPRAAPTPCCMRSARTAARWHRLAIQKPIFWANGFPPCSNPLWRIRGQITRGAGHARDAGAAWQGAEYA